jgi:predicted ATPase
VDLFQRLLQFHTEDTSDEKLRKLEYALSQYRLPLEETVPLFAPLLSLPLPQDRYPLLNLSPQRQRQKTLEAIVAILLELAERQPVLFIVEDLHWTDPTTLELLNLVIEQTPTASLLTVPTCRPHFQPSWHHRSYITEMTLNHLSHTQVDQIVTGMTDGKAFPPEVLQQIMAKTDGVPLFVEEITKAILESGQLTTVDGHYAVIGSFATFTIPATLHDSLMARLDRLVTAKAVAQYAAVIGRQFPYDLLHAVSHLDEAMLQHELGRLVEAEIVFQRGLPPQATYTFKHALIQEAAYQSLLKSTRQQYHQRIAQVLEARFPALCATQPELLAHHYTEAGLRAQALPYWQRAGERALQRSANLEAISHLTRGLEVLASLPEYPEGAQQELMCLIPLGVSLTATQGFGAPEAGRVYARARALCQQLGDTSQLFQVLRGLQVFHLLRAELQTARDLGEQLLSLARRQQDPLYLMMAHQVLGGVLFWLGELAPAHAELEQGIARYQPQQHRAMAASYGVDNGVVGYCYAAWVLWSLGYPDQAVQRSRVALTLAQEGAHPYSLAFALNWAATLQMLLRQGQATQEWAEATISQTSEHGFPLYLAFSTVLRGWALARQGQRAEGIGHIHQGLAAYRATGAALAQPWHLALLAEAYQHARQTEEGLAALAEALTAVHNTGERVYEAELYRLQGALRLAQSPDYAAEAEACFHRALDVARAQQAKSWELRATMSLSRLWQQQGKRAEGYERLAPIYGWFTEGLDTADLRDAKTLLEELRG